MIFLGAFEDPDIIHVDDLVDPVRDLETISAELRLKVCFLLVSNYECLLDYFAVFFFLSVCIHLMIVCCAFGFT